MTIGRKDVVVARVAAHNGGPFARRDARRAGLTPEQIEHRVRAELWHTLLPGVYLPAGVALTVDIWRRAALLWAGPTSVLSHHSAGEVWQLDNVEDTKPEIVVQGTRHPRSKLVRVHRTLDLSPADIRRIDGVRLTSPTRTVIDLASVLDQSALRIAFESARRQRLTTVKQVRRRMDEIGGAGRPGAAKLEALLTRLDGKAPSEFPLEVTVAEILERSNLPSPVPQFKVVTAGRTYRLDFAWPEQRVALECDGRLRHSEDSDFENDRVRWSLVAAAGWRVLFVTWREAQRQAADVIQRVRRALAA
jgi:very-short-patch-repair endonuclease